MKVCTPYQRPPVIHHGGRGSGRTTKMVHWLRGSPDRILVVSTQNEARMLIDRFNLHDRKGDVVSRGSIGGPLGGREVGVDDVDRVLAQYLGVYPKAYSVETSPYYDPRYNLDF